MSFLSRLFQKEQKAELEAADMSRIIADMHSHLLPGIDDGAQNMEESIFLIRALHELGYKRFVTTPHIFQDIYRNTPETILPKLELVRQELRRLGIPVELDAAAEYYLDETFENLIQEKALLTFGNNHVLFELSFISETPSLGRAIFNMHIQGYRPILAHPERYEYWHNDFSKYESMRDKDVALQLNINSLTGNYGPGVKKISEKLIDAGLISYIGSDCHHVGHIELLHRAVRNPYLHKLIDSGKLKNAGL